MKKIGWEIFSDLPVIPFIIQFSLYPKKEVPALFNQKTRWDYGTHREEFRAVFNRPDGKKYKGDWIKLLTTMLNRYAPLISSVQARYFSLPKDESYSACLLGYYQAMVRYVDEALYEKENYHLARHLNYYMRSECQKEMRNDRTIHIPHNKLIDFQKAKASNLFERDPESLSDEELELKRDLELVVLPAIMSPSMDTPINEDTTIADVIPAKGIVEINDEYNATERSLMLKRCLNRLNDIQCVCVVLNKGLCGHEEQSLRQIADRIGISHTKVGEHVKKGVESLKVIMFEHEDLSIYTQEHGSNWTF